MKKKLLKILFLFLFGFPFAGLAQPCTNGVQLPVAAQVIPTDGTFLSVATSATDYFVCTVLSGKPYLAWSTTNTDEMSVWGTSNGTGSLGYGTPGATFYVMTTPTTGTSMWIDINKNGVCGGTSGARTVDVALLPYNITVPAGVHCVGDVITITGNALSTVISVQFAGGVSAAASAVTATSFNVTIPAGALSGGITLTAQESGAYQWTLLPSINSLTMGTASGVSFAPTGGGIGDVVIISGNNLLGATNVKINGTAATGVVVTNTQITCTVAAGTTTGNVTFTDGCGNAVNAGVFTIAALTNYYYDGVGLVTAVGSWWANSNKTGAHPPNFTTNGQRFNFINWSAAPTLTVAWTVTGTGAGIIVGDGVAACNFTVPAGFALNAAANILRVNANATLTLNNNTIPTLSACVCNLTSTVIFGNAASSTIPGITYGNLTISGTGPIYTFGGASTIAGTLNISTANTVRLNNTATVYIFNIVNFTMSNGTLDGGSGAPAGANYNSILNITGNFNKTGGVTSNTGYAGGSPLTQINFNGGGAQSFNLNAATVNAYLYVATNVQNNTTLTLNTNLTTTGIPFGTNAINFLTVDAGSTLTAGANLITSNTVGGNVILNGTLQTANTLGLSGAAGTTLSSTNASTMALGTTSTVEYNAGAAQAVTARTDYTNLTITNNSVKTAGGACTLSGDLTINATATFAAGAFTHNIAGNWANSGTFTANTSTINFNDNAAQTIGGSHASTFNNLTINNSLGVAGGVTLSVIPAASTIVTGALTLTNGILFTTSTNLLTMNAGSTATSGTATSFVDGPISKIGTTAFVFPTGNLTYWAPIGISAPATANSQFTATSFHHSGKVDGYDTAYAFMTTPNIQKVSRDEYWTLSRDVNSDPVTVKLYWETNAPASYINDCASGDLVVAHWNTGSSKWENAQNGVPVYTGACGAGQAGTVSTNGTWNLFSPFTFGSKTKGSGVNPLPVELLKFDANPDGNVVNVKWTTASEFNSDYFMVQRSKDGNVFEDVEQVKAAINSNTMKNYSSVDYEPHNDISYYRLKQADNNGAFTYSDMVAVKFHSEDAMSVYPNPSVQGEPVHISISGQNGKAVMVVVRNLQGQEFYSKVILISSDREAIAIDASGNLASGVYFVVATSNDAIYKKKIVIR